MRMIFGLVLVAGLGLAGFAVYMAQNYIGAYEAALAAERRKNAETVSLPTADIWVANRVIRYGEPIAEDDVRLARWPAESLPDGFFDKEATIAGAGIRPRVALRQIEKNEALMKIKVSEPGGEASLTTRLDRGQRAFAIKVDVASGVSGFLRPGDRVDIYWTGRGESSGAQQTRGDVTKLIETGIELIAIDQTATVDDSTTSAIIARTVTVAASPQQVAALAQAQSTGNLSLSLMAPDDDTIAEAIEVDQRALLGIEATTATKTKAPEVCTIRTRRGSEVVEIPIPCTN
ncbi:Flp pilus assembly protein CpaB [Roseivivax sediminis]|uniref:Pilus assembly protein CpaB n=1 Tax=Roseivivax sediminis TaxID=936889 RepID=A0A1I1SNI7_9RHOB|nr:Flp pilus assembly protein CpaB [Roseivivax sediminis]SFD47882.1 pilus assembly protein CpaB [Roseivivax sediminis]